MDFDIIHVMDHYEGYIGNRFIVSGDTYYEVYRDMIDYLEKR